MSDKNVTNDKNVTQDLSSDKAVLRYKPHAAQKKVHESKARFKIICAGRQSGKSILCGADVISRCLSGKYNEHSTIAWVAPTLNTAKRGVDALKLITKECPDLITWYKSAPITATFPNGVKILFLSADNEDGLRGYSFDHVIIDEADFLADYLWDDVLRAALAANKASLMAISSPRARGTWFHKLYMQGIAGNDKSIESFNFPSSANPKLTKEELDKIKQSTPEMIFRREYLAEWTDSGGEVFQKIERCLYKDHSEDCKCNSNTILGLDLGKEVDFTVIVGLCAKCRHIKFIKRFNDIDWEIQKQMIKNVYISTDTPTVIMDSTGVGNAIYDGLTSIGVKITPFHFSNSSKQQLINNLRIHIMEGNIKWRADLENANILRHELECYEVQETRTGLITYNARQGVDIHDDTVIALALACNGLSSFISPIVCPKEEKVANDFTMNFVEVDNSFDFCDNNQVFFA